MLDAGKRVVARFRSGKVLYGRLESFRVEEPTFRVEEEVGNWTEVERTFSVAE